MRAFGIVSIAVFAAVSGSARAESFTCPAEIESDATAGGAPQSFKFRYVSFYDGDPAEMADLAPGEGPDPKKLEQRWQFERTPGRPIVMVCRYHGTQATVRKDVPANIRECRIEGELDGKGEVVGSPKLTCK